MKEPPKIIAAAPTLVVPDVVRTAEYYRDILNFRILGYFGEPPVYAMVRRDECEIHFGRSRTGGAHYNWDIRPATADFVVWVPELEDFYAELTARNVEIVQKIVKRPYGQEFIIRDCDGHRILVVD